MTTQHAGPTLADRLPPHDIAAEEAVIASLLVDGDRLSTIPGLKPEHFYRERHRFIFEACLNLNQRREAINHVTIAHELERAGKLETAGGSAYLSHVVAKLPTSVHIQHYARIVQRTATSRQLIATAHTVADIGYSDLPDINQALDQAEGAVLSVRQDSKTSGRTLRTLRQVVDQENLFDRYAATGIEEGFETTATPTGLIDLDRIIGGLTPGALYVIGAATHVGKSSFMLQLLYNLATNGHPAAYFSLEMADTHIARALVEIHLNTRFSALDTPQKRLDAQPAIVNAFGHVQDLNILCTERPGLSTSQLHSLLLQAHASRGGPITAAFVDYLQIMRPDIRYKSQTRNEIVAEQTAALKAMARDFNIAIVTASQLNREYLSEADKRPRLGHLRDSGAIEQDADVILLLHSQDYLVAEKLIRPNDVDVSRENTLEVHIAKNRLTGRNGTLDLHFDRTRARISNSTRPVTPSAAEGPRSSPPRTSGGNGRTPTPLFGQPRRP